MWGLRVCLLLAVAAIPGSAQELKVRLFALNPPDQLEVQAAGASWRTITADGSTVRLAAGAKIRTPGGVVALPGPAEVRPERGRMLLTVAIPLEAYTAAVVAGEAGGLPKAAAEAIAIAARSYAWRRRGHHGNFDVCDTTHCQDLRLTGLSATAREAAAATRGQFLWFEGELADAYHHRGCGGSTDRASAVWRDIRAPYLQPVEDTACRADRWSRRLTLEELWQSLGRTGSPAGTAIRMKGRTPGGRVQQWEIGRELVSAAQIRMEVGRLFGFDRIPSNRYTLSQQGPVLLLEGSGSGHGVGLCQTGAARMARSGATARQILERYFPATEVGASAKGFRWQTISGSRVAMWTTQPGADGPRLPLAEAALAEAERRTGFRWAGTPRLRVYPTVARFRDATGEPGWVAASTGPGETGELEIRVQPLGPLQRKGLLHGVLLHEFAHGLVEAQAVPGLPLWFREGLVLHLLEPPAAATPGPVAIRAVEAALRRPASEAELRRTYAQAQAAVARLERQYSLADLLRWVAAGLPAELRRAPAIP